jgi:aspartyl-tRNA(Asn)/glutamyl-tRNA(Gln) amidotransferase subunit A
MLPRTFHSLSLRELGAGLRARRFTSVELTEGVLARLVRLGWRFNAVVTLTRERALEEARRADGDFAAGRDRGPLQGIPYGVKDLLATSGIPTTWGAEPYRSQVFDEDAEVVRRLGAAGAVLVAKLSMVELAGGMGYNHAEASFNGPGINPYNARYWSGGSSSGPGSAVGAALVPFALGSETSGSILTPSAFSGVTGLRPTYGLVSRRGAMALSWTLDKVGPMARSADDCGLVLSAIAGQDAGDPTTVDTGFEWAGPPDPALVRRRPWRIAVPKGVTEKAQPAVRRNFERALAALGDGTEITRDVEWPDFPWGPAVGTIVQAEGASAFLDLIESGGLARLRCPRDRWAGYGGTAVSAVDYLQAMRLRGPMKDAVNALFERHDFVAAPTRPSVAYPIDLEFQKAWPGVAGGPPLIPAGNLCGLPAICLPTGTGEAGLPTSISFMSAAFDEASLLQVGHDIQSRTKWHRGLPKGVGA